NGGVQFIHPEKNYGFSISYNVVGPRIYIVGNTQEPDVWEKQRHVLDFQITKGFLKNKLELKLNVRDLLAQDLIFYQNHNVKNPNYEKDVDRIWQKTNYGQNISLNVSYKF
ncbi:MAG: outer membrane beta-barrel protein, partial [Bacteroidia bacterium]